MWGTRRVAEEAKAMAEKVSWETNAVATLTREHINDCNRRAEALARELAARDLSWKEDQREWRAGLGERLDKQDRMNWVVAGTVIMGLATAVASLMHTLGFIK